MYSRWPQVGEPCLHPPPTPKFAFAGSCVPEAVVMMKPPPVRKAHVFQALAAPPLSTRAATASRLIALRIVPPPLASRYGSRVIGKPWLSVGGLQRGRAPAAAAGHRGRHDHVGNAGDDGVKRVHHHGAVRPNLLFV